MPPNKCKSEIMDTLRVPAMCAIWQNVGSVYLYVMKVQYMATTSL